MIYLKFAKGKKDRYTLLSDVALKRLREYYRRYKPREYLFEGLRPRRGAEGRKHLSERSVQHVLHEVVHKAGIWKKVSVHSLRHSFATHLPREIVCIFFAE